MSLILEALKKSEQQRRLGEAPTLGSPALTSRRRRSAVPLLVALSAIALGVGWWVLRPTSKAPLVQTDASVNPTPSLGAPKPVTAAAHPPLAEERNLKPVLAKEHANQPAKPTVPTQVAANKPEQVANDRANAVTSRLTMPLGDRPGSVAQLPPALPMVAGPMATAAPPPKPMPAPAVAPVIATPKPALPVAAAAPAATNATVPTPPSTPMPKKERVEPALPSVWELPYAMRKDLPDLALTMHVYADDPHKRFVVIKGDRHVEGDDIGGGVILYGIRPDGIVLEVNGKRFTYPRDGR
ncbi:MAG: general secretion pathway protein GspB [Dokdonella sp.]